MKRIIIILGLMLWVLVVFADVDVSGDVSGTWTIVNSPYNIVGNTFIQSGEILTIEPGVEIIFNGNFIFVIFGTVFATGFGENEIYFHGADNIAQGEIVIDEADNPVNFEYCRFEYLANYFSEFYDDFNDGEWSDNWSGSAYQVETTTEYYHEGTRCLKILANSSGDTQAATNNIEVSGNCKISFWYMITHSTYDCRTIFYYRKNEGTWTELWSTDFSSTNDWEYKEFDMSNLVSAGDNIQFKCLSAISSNSQIQITYLDEVTISTSSAAINISSTSLTINNSIISSNSTIGIYGDSNSNVNLNYCTIAHNSDYGIKTESGFSNITNSIIYSNNLSNSAQQIYCNGSLDVSYSDIQGYASYGYGGNDNVNWGAGCIESNPAFADEDYHLSESSPCVDGASPWQHDANMPFGLGSIRADMGAYGGPNNGGWGGNPIPNGTPTIDNIIDIPQDQGGFVGIQYQASIFDGQHTAYDVTHYSFWRELAVENRENIDAQIHPIYSKSNKNIIYTRDGEYWEWVGEMVSQDFSNYGYIAETIADSIAGNPNETNYMVVAHTTDDQVYWLSEPITGYSVDNIAPLPPQNIGRNISVDNVTINWDQSQVEDYQSTILRRNGEVIFEGSGTEYVDEDIEADTGYIYEISHKDYHLNESEPSTIDLRTISWDIQCVATMNQSYSNLVLGVAEDATEGYDIEYDQPAPPSPPFNYVSIFTHHPSWENPLGTNFKQDIINSISLDDMMQVWEINLLSDNSGYTDVSFNFSETIPEVPVYIYQEINEERNGREIVSKEQITDGETYTFDLEENTNQVFFLAIGDTTPPEVTVAYPNGLEILQSDVETTFSWDATDGYVIESNDVSISYDGETYTEVGTTQDNSISFIPENSLSNNCYVKVVSTDFAGNSSEDISDYEFTVVGNELSSEFQAGWSMWSSPLQLETSVPEQIEDDFDGQYFAYNWFDGGYTEVDNIATGQSVWLGFMGEAQFTVTGNPYTSNQAVDYVAGWNMIANPMVRDIDKSMLVIIVGEQEYTFDEAVANGFIEDNIYQFSNNSYETIDELEYMKGYWLGVYEDEITILYQPHEAIQEIRKVRDRDFYWQVTINNLNIAGMENTSVAWDENDIPLPPADPTGYIADIYISHPEWDNPLGDNFRSDIRPSEDLEETQLYSIIINNSQILSWSLTDIDDDVEVHLQIDDEEYDLKEIEQLEILEPTTGLLSIGRNILGIDDDIIPLETKLYGNYPNPFNPTTNIEFALKQASNVELTIYNSKGQKVKSLVNNHYEAGKHNVIWNGDDSNGSQVSSGIYFYHLSAGDYSRTNKMILMK